MSHKIKTINKFEINYYSFKNNGIAFSFNITNYTRYKYLSNKNVLLLYFITSL